MPTLPTLSAEALCEERCAGCFLCTNDPAKVVEQTKPETQEGMELLPAQGARRPEREEAMSANASPMVAEQL